VSEGPRCADWAREAGVDPVGTAGRAAGWLLVDWPLPWPRDASEVEPLAPVHEAVRGTGIRVQLLVPRPEAPTRSVVLHKAPDADGWFGGYERSGREVAPADVVEAALDLLAGGAGDPSDGPVTDVLVCGHGSRDRCCGSMGTGLALGALASGIEVRRTSHTGGHRFAPTAVLLPEGTSWAFLDEDALARVVHRAGTLDDLLPRYRGCTAIGSPAVQAAEREAFGDVGWGWLDHRRRGVELGDGQVRIEAVAPTGDQRTWEAEVAPGRLLPVPECGRPPEEAPKSEAEVVVRGFRRDLNPSPAR
jgi:hypothetical protein